MLPTDSSKPPSPSVSAWRHLLPSVVVTVSYLCFLYCLDQFLRAMACYMHPHPSKERCAELIQHVQLQVLPFVLAGLLPIAFGWWSRLRAARRGEALKPAGLTYAASVVLLAPTLLWVL